MQILSPERPRGRVGFLVPRWTAAPTRNGQGIPFRSVPVAGALLRAGWEVVFADQDAHLDRADHGAALRDALRGVRLVFLWMSELDPMVQTINTVKLARMVKAWYPDARVAAGGAFVSIVPPEGLYLDGPVDYFLRGYGETSCIALLDALEGRIDASDVPGLVWRDGSFRHNAVGVNERIRAEDHAILRHLDLSPFVQKGDVFGNDEDTFTLALANGCPKGCSFCYWRDFEPSLLQPEAGVELLADLHERYGVRQFHIADLDFATNRRRALRIATLIRERIPGCAWFALMSPVDAVRFSDAEWDLLAASGLRKIEFGTESGALSVLAAMGKRHRPEDSITVTAQCLRRGIVPMHNFVFGTPGESDADRRESLRLIHRLRRMERSWVAFTFRFFQPAWGTPMGEKAMAADPDYPRRLDRIVEQRAWFGAPDVHAMRWLQPGVERRIKELVYYFLPITTSKLDLSSRVQRSAWRILKGLAALRLATRFHGCGVDRWLYARLVGAPLDSTYTP